MINNRQIEIWRKQKQRKDSTTKKKTAVTRRFKILLEKKKKNPPCRSKIKRQSNVKTNRRTKKNHINI